MFLVRDFSKETLKKDQPIFQTLRACTSEKRILINPSTTEYIRVGSYKYREQDLLGKGFSSRVYKASHLNNSQDRYAIKVINLKKFKTSNLTMLQSQIEVHRNLNHPNIVQFYDAYKTDNFYYIITEYCPHGDLMELLNQKKKLEQSKAQAVIEQIIQGYVYLSKKMVLHRDLKPANIFRSGDTWKIGDFGFSIVCRSQSFYDKINVGTPLYMPLQSLKTNKYSPRSDIFAVGIILYELITGRTPWQCKTEKQLVAKMKSEAIKMPALKSPEIRKFITRACEVDENLRLPVGELANFFNPTCSFTNPQQKQNDKRTLKNILSMKSFKEPPKLPMAQSSKNATLTLCSKQTPTNPSITTTTTTTTTTAYEPSTEVSQKSDSHRVKESLNEKNNKLLLQELQFCRLMYYMVKNIKYFVIGDQRVKSFMCLTLFKHLLRVIKQLEEPGSHYSGQLANFDSYQNDKQYKKLAQQIKSYSKRYQKQYLQVLKNTQISVIRSVNKKFPELSYNSTLSQTFYRSYYTYFLQQLRLLNHSVSANEANETEKALLSAGYQAVDSLNAYCAGLREKMLGCEGRKVEVFGGFSGKVVMDYRGSKADRRGYEELRLRMRNL